ncbi:MAG: hypothetical protein Kow0098_01600 [Ignavibacteriaceae bacterium]
MKYVSITALILFLCFETVVAQDTVTTESGLKYVVIEKGNGPDAEPGKELEVHYTGKFTDGKIFDSSVERGEPFFFVLGEGKVIKGWDEGLDLMQAGDKFTFIIPYYLAYGEGGRGIIPPKATLIFDVELLGVYEAKLSLADTLLMTLFENGLDDAVARYKYIKSNQSDQYNTRENQLNMLGYQLLKAGMNSQAIEFFKLNAEAFPESANVYDSLAEAYMIAGKNEEALLYYQKSLELDPSNENAKQMIEKLKQN